MNKNTKINFNKPFWSLKIDDALSSLKTSKSGLKDQEIKDRLRDFGLNKLGNNKRFSKIKILLNQFKSPLIFILIIACLATILVQEWVDAGVIFLAIAVNTILGFYQENRAENAIERLRSYIKERAIVIRDGKKQEVDASQLVPGDIIYLTYGNRIPADARLIESKNLSVDESILTGESLPVSKSLNELSEGTDLPERKNMIFGGTVVVEGYATAVITATGPFTE
ncbi:MAG: HAD-IC family P-type ATPase, partial [Candidatus Paceibacterota bacterium]